MTIIFIIMSIIVITTIAIIEATTKLIQLFC